MLANKIIVIGGNHPNTLGLIRSIGEKGLPVYLMLEPCSTLDYCNLRFSKYITKMYLLKSEEEVLTILHTDFKNEEERPIILCGSDASVSLLDSHYDELKDCFYFFNAGEQGRINHFMDKINMFPLAAKCGLNVIKTWHIKDKTRIPDDITFPCLTKPNNSLGGDKEDIHICYNKDELETCLRDNVDYLIQEYIEKEYELDINGFAYNHGRDVVLPAAVRKIRDKSYRQSDYIVLEDISRHTQVDKNAICKFVSTIGFEGLFSIEFLCKKDRAYFLEINMRNDGVGYLYTKTGANHPYLWALYSTGNLTESIINNVRCKTPTYLMQQADFSNVLHHELSFTRWLRDLCRTRAFFVLNIRDPKPFLFTLLVNFRILLEKLHLKKKYQHEK